MIPYHPVYPNPGRLIAESPEIEKRHESSRLVVLVSSVWRV